VIDKTGPACSCWKAGTAPGRFVAQMDVASFYRFAEMNVEKSNHKSENSDIEEVGTSRSGDLDGKGRFVRQHDLHWLSSVRTGLLGR
jgi:hypothetical protein